MIVFRHADPRFPFLWEDVSQPGGRWHDRGEGPVQYFADTPLGAWAELLRHEEIREAEDLSGVRRALWAVDIPETAERPELPEKILTGGLETYTECRREAARLRAEGSTELRVTSAALLPGGASGWIVDGGLQPGPERDGKVHVVFGRRPDLVGWPVILEGRPPEDLLLRVRHF